VPVHRVRRRQVLPRRRRPGRHHGVASGLSAADRERPRAQRDSVLRRAPVPGVFAERPHTGTGLQKVADGRRLHQTLAGVLIRHFRTLFDTCHLHPVACRVGQKAGPQTHDNSSVKS